MPATKSALRGSPSSVPALESANKPHVEKSRFTAPVTKSDRLEDHHHVQSAGHATKSDFLNKPLRSLAPVTKSRLWTTKSASCSLLGSSFRLKNACGALSAPRVQPLTRAYQGGRKPAVSFNTFLSGTILCDGNRIARLVGELDFGAHMFSHVDSKVLVIIKLKSKLIDLLGAACSTNQSSPPLLNPLRIAGGSMGDPPE